MSKKVRLGALFLVACLLISMMPIGVMAADEDEASEIVSTIPKKEGTIYKITTAEELQWIEEMVAGGYSFAGETVYLMNDIDLKNAAWKGIGYNLNNYFSGVFQGNGHTIRNFVAENTIDAYNIINAPRHTTGLFGVCNQAKIQNLVLENVMLRLQNDSGYHNSYSSIDGTSIYGGIVCGYAIDSTFQNIIVRNSAVTITTGAEAAYAHAGGIVGYAEACNFAHCGNEGAVVQAISDSLNNDAYGGGIVGKFVNEGVIRQCYNLAAVGGKSSIATAYVGGVIGYSDNTSTTLSSIRDCYNQGVITCNAQMMSNGVAGGIMGYSYSTVNRCYNSGSIIASKSYIGTMSLGGISGFGSEASSISNSAVISASISGGTESSVIANGGTKENNIAVSGLSATNDANSLYPLSAFYGEMRYRDGLSWNFSQIWEAHVDGYPTLKYVDADLEADIIAVDAAAETVQIAFAKGDSYDKVTQNVTLLGNSTMANIAWSSSNGDVLSNQGVVNRKNVTYQVRLTATISSGMYSVQKRFVLDVLGVNEVAEAEAADWAMKPDQARQFIATMRRCKIQEVDWADPDVQVLMGVNTEQDAVVSTLSKIMSFWEVPGEIDYLKQKIEVGVVDLIKSGEDQVLKSLVSDFSDGWVSWDEDSESAHVNGTTVAKNIIKIPGAIFNVQMDFIGGYQAFKGLGDINFQDNPLNTALDYGGKIGKVIDFIYKTNSSLPSVNTRVFGLGVSKTVGALGLIQEAFELYNAYQISIQNKIKAYLKMYMDNRPAFDSAEDEIFQMIMSAHVITSGFSAEQLEELEQTAEQLYILYDKFGGGLADAYKITIRCPVDVAVYDCTGKLVGRVVNNRVDYSIPNALQITLGGKDHDEKTILFQDGDAYSISMIGNDAGVMSVQIERQDSISSVNYTYENIALDLGKTMLLDVTAESFTGEDDDLPTIVVMEEGQTTEKVETIDTTDLCYPLTVYGCLAQEDDTVELSVSGGYCEETYVPCGISISSLIHVNAGYLLEGLYQDVNCQIPYLSDEMPDHALTVYAKFLANTTGITIVSQPRNGMYDLYEPSQALEVVTDDNTKYTFQWYRYRDDKENAVAIPGANASTYVPSTEEEGTTYYYVQVSLQSGEGLFTLDSAAAEIVVKKPLVQASGDLGEGKSWLLTLDGTLEISGAGAMPNFEDESAPWFPNRHDILRIQISDGITHIGDFAFSGCYKLQSVEIPDSVETVGEAVLKNCNSLQNMTIPFVGSSRDASQTKDAVLGHWFGIVQDGVVQYYTLSGTSMKGYAYGIPSSLRTVTFTSATQIPYGAFYNCTQLTAIILNEGIEQIAENGFYGCRSLTEIMIPSSVQFIEEGAFYKCDGLLRMTLPFIGTSRTAAGYEGVFGIVFGRVTQSDTQTVVQYHALEGTSLRGYAYNIPLGLREVTVQDISRLSIGAFSNLTTVASLYLPEELKTIENLAFYDCTGLQDIYYSGTWSNWNTISIGTHNEPLFSATLHCQADPVEVPVERITLENVSLSMKEGETATLIATVFPENATNRQVNWTSDNPQVASIEHGVLIAKKAGAALITATAADGSGAAAVCTIGIYTKRESGLEHISLNTKTLLLAKGETTKISATVSPADAVNPTLIWTSSAPRVVQVDEVGTISALQAGTANITATSADGTINASCTVEVKDATLAEIVVTGQPSEVLEGQALDVSSMHVTARYSDGTEAEVSDYNISFPDRSPGTQNACVKYREKSLEFPVTVIQKSPVSISISQYPAKRLYEPGSTLDIEGLELMVTYDNGTEETVKQGYTVEPVELETLGWKKVTVTYSGLSADFRVEVCSKENGVAAIPEIGIEETSGGKRVTLKTATEGAVIYYTLDGSCPTTASEQYLEALDLQDTTVLKAMAAAPGMENSKVSSSRITVPQVEAPAVSRLSGTIPFGTVVTLETSTEDAAIYYTTDGTIPTMSSARYAGAIVIVEDTTLRAIAVKDGFANSAETVADYSVSDTSKPIVSILAGTVTGKAGAMVEIPIHAFFAEDVELTNLTFNLCYDSNMLSFAGGSQNIIVKEQREVGIVSVFYNGMGLDSGEICSLYFYISEDAVNERCALRLSAFHSTDSVAFSAIDGLCLLEDEERETLTASAFLTAGNGQEIRSAEDISDGHLVANLIFEQPSVSSCFTDCETISAIIALYDDAGRLISNRVKQIDTTNLSHVCSVELQLPDQAVVGEAKVMLLSEFPEYMPRCDAVALLS